MIQPGCRIGLDGTGHATRGTFGIVLLERIYQFNIFHLRKIQPSYWQASVIDKWPQHFLPTKAVTFQGKNNNKKKKLHLGPFCTLYCTMLPMDGLNFQLFGLCSTTFQLEFTHFNYLSKFAECDRLHTF